MPSWLDPIFSLFLLIFAVGFWRRGPGSALGAALMAASVLLGLLLLVAHATINRLTGSGIDASVIYHMQTGFETAGLAGFSGLAVAAGMGVLASLAAAVVSYRLVRADTLPGHGVGRMLAGAACLLGAFWMNPAVADLAHLVTSAQRTAATTSEPLPEQFVPAKAVTFAANPRNFVLLYLESVERSYLDDARFPGLMPNLKALEAEAISFTNITEVGEASWTIAGMVASQCGMPLVGSGAGIDVFLPGATCLGDLLKRQGYDLTYLGGADLEFAGKGTFYQSHGFNRIEGRSELLHLLDDPTYVNDWGLFDDSLYTVATGRFDALAGGDKPFGLVLLTLDTHHPFGFLSRSCADQPYEDGSNQFLTAAHCADRLAAEFIRHVRASPAFKDTVLIVASDHMAMPNLAESRLETGERRNLLLVFSPDLSPALIDKPGTTLDIGPTLLGLIGSPTPALGFGRDLLASTPTLRESSLGPESGSGLEDLIAAGRGSLAAMWSFPQLTQGLTVDPTGTEVILGKRRLKLPVLFHLNDALEVSAIDFDLASDMTLTERVATLPDDQRLVWLDACARTATFAATPAPDGEALCVLAGRVGNPDLRQTVVEGGVPIPPRTLMAAFTPDPQAQAAPDALMSDLNRRRQFATSNVVDYTPPNGLTGKVAIRSAGFLNGNSWAMNPVQGDRVALIRGLTLLGLTPDAAPVKIGHVDTCGYGGHQIDRVPLETGFQAAIEAQDDRFGAFVIVAHDSVVCYGVDPGLEPLFAGTGLTKWRDLWYEQPYVAVIAGNGEVAEFAGPRQTALGVDLRDFMRPWRQGEQPAAREATGGLVRTLAPGARVEVVSSGYGSGDTVLRTLGTNDAGALALARGVNLVALTPGAAPVLLARFDGCAALDTGTPPDPAPFRHALMAALAEGRTLALVVHDSAFCDGVALGPILAETPLVKAVGLGFRAPYVGLIRTDGSVQEFTGPPETQLRQTLTIEVTP